MRNNDVRRRVLVRKNKNDSLERKVIKWFGHREYIRGEQMTKRLYESKVEKIGLETDLVRGAQAESIMP